MLNYWWSARATWQVPKYYLFDFYFVSLVMFIFSQMPQHLLKIDVFIYWLAGFFVVDCLYSLLSIWVYRETAEEPLLWFYIKGESVLFVVYLMEAFLIKEITLVNIFLVVAPYLIWCFASITQKKFAKKFIDTGKQPY